MKPADKLARSARLMVATVMLFGGWASIAASASPQPASDCLDCTPAPLGWGYVGGEAVWRLAGQISGCRSFQLNEVEQHKYEDVGKRRFRRLVSECRGEVPACDTAGDLGMRELGEALTQPDVIEAFRTAPALYGRDMRQFDAPIFQVTLDGRELMLGSTCTTEPPPQGSVSCSIPKGLVELRSLLFELHKQLRQAAECTIEEKR